MTDSYQGMVLFSVSTITALIINHQLRKQKLQMTKKLYTGSCHCGKLKFEVTAPRHLVAWDCNCSVCIMKKNWHFIVPYKDFTILEGRKYLTLYRFNTMIAKHIFCSICGVQAYYHPRSNPDGIAVTLACIPSEQVESFEIRRFDGNNWESFFHNSGISAFSSSS